MADKFIQLHPTNETTNLIDEEVNLYPLIKPNSFKNFETEGETFEPQKKLVSGTNIKSLTVDENVISLLGTGSVNLPALLLDIFYPIGSIYMSTVKDDEDEDVCPLAKFGGTWERIKDKFLWAKGDTDELLATGGSKDAVAVSHTHNMLSDGSHYHGITINNKTLTQYPYVRNFYNRTLSEASNLYFNDGQVPQGISISLGSPTSTKMHYLLEAYTQGASTDWTYLKFNESHNHTASCANAGGHTHEILPNTISGVEETGEGKNMPPYLVVMIWKRIA